VVPLDARGRKSIRLESKQRYNEGLFVVSLAHAPVSCGAWPAFWMFGSLDVF
jgi:beta-glucanase (GH16 family)